MYLCIALRVLQPEPALSDNCFITEGCFTVSLEKLHSTSSSKENAILHMMLAQRARAFAPLFHLCVSAMTFAGCMEPSFKAEGVGHLPI